MSWQCTHYACRCARAEELCRMDLMLEAIAVHEQQVRCRQVCPSCAGETPEADGRVCSSCHNLNRAAFREVLA